MNPWQVPGDILPGLRRILERVHRRDVWSYRPLFQQSRDSRRARSPDGASLIIIPDTRCLAASSWRYRLDGRNEMPAFLQDEERPLLCIATDQVEDHIDFLSQNLLELRFTIIDNPAGPDGLEVRLIVALAVAMTVAPACDANCTA